MSEERGCVVPLGRARRPRRRKARPSVLSEWRRPVVNVESASFRAVTDELEGVSLFAEQSWIEARDSDVSRAIAIAVDRLWDPPVSAAVCDLILSLLWVWACRGEVVASMTLEVLKARPHLAELARSRDGKMRTLGNVAGAIDGEPTPTSL